jgi:hypothetical protein
MRFRTFPGPNLLPLLRGAQFKPPLRSRVVQGEQLDQVSDFSKIAQECDGFLVKAKPCHAATGHAVVYDTAHNVLFEMISTPAAPIASCRLREQSKRRLTQRHIAPPPSFPLDRRSGRALCAAQLTTGF